MSIDLSHVDTEQIRESVANASKEITVLESLNRLADLIQAADDRDDITYTPNRWVEVRPDGYNACALGGAFLVEKGDVKSDISSWDVSEWMEESFPHLKPLVFIDPYNGNPHGLMYIIGIIPHELTDYTSVACMVRTLQPILK